MVEDLLVSMKTYLNYNVRIGVEHKTKPMSKFIYRVKPNGLTILDISKTDKRLRVASKFLARFEPKKIFAVGRREESIRPIDKFGEVTGVKTLTGKYHPGILTNPSYRHYFEPSILLACDPWVDKQAIRDALRSNIPIISLVNTNDVFENLDLVVPCNNREEKSLGLVYYIMAREYLKEKGEIEENGKVGFEIKDFYQEERKNKKEEG